MNLKYLFTVEFTDRTSFKQEKDDVSKLDPKRSAFYDIENNGKKIKKFTLGKLFDKWSVDLITGEFTHNGYKFQLEENPTSGKKKALVFFRQHQHDTVNGQETDHRVIYFIGYKTEKKQFLVGVK